MKSGGKGCVIAIILLLSSIGILPEISAYEHPSKTIYVDDDNTEGPWDGSLEHPFHRIQDAVDNATEGDTIYVFNGLYLRYPRPTWEPLVVINKSSIRLLGENKDSTILDYDGKQHAVIKIESDNVEIHGFTLKEGMTGVVITSDFNYISDNRILDPTRGIYIADNKNNIIANNRISNCSDGIVLRQTTENHIVNNTLQNSGVLVHYPYTGNNTIINNSVNGKPLVYLENRQEVSISEDAGQIILLNCERITIQGKTIEYSNRGVQLLRCQSCNILDNIISNNGYGFYLHYSHNTTIRKNEIKNNGRGLLLLHSHNNTISSNRVLLNSYGVWIGDYTSPTEFSDNNDIVRNLIKNNKDGICVFYSRNCSIHGNNFYDNDKDAFQQRLSSSIWNVNNWNGNFWGRPRVLPKLIPSYIGIFGFTFDWHPAREPYNIGGET